jgi:acyl-CoA synthetase (AMP-forming)/AMP-acid ligase II
MTAPHEGLVLPPRRPAIPTGPQSVADVLDRGLRDSPEKVALRGPRGQLTYGELDLEANRAAHALIASGVRGGDRVGASLPNDIDIVVAFLGAMRIGAVWVGLARAASEHERRDLAADCALSVLLCDRATAVAIDGVRTVVVDPTAPGAEWTELLATAPSTRPDVEVDPFAPAAISYTSGTTGRPKGVVHTQHNILVPAAVTVSRGAYGRDEPIGSVHPQTILNIMVLSAVIAFQAGSRCVISEVRDAVAIANWIEAEEVAVISLAPTLIHDLVTNPAVSPESLRSVTKMRSGGAPVSDTLRAGYQERFGTRLCSSFGTTEIMTFATREDVSEPYVEGTVGRALPHQRILILDDDDRPLPPGDIGEICVAASTEGEWAGVYLPMLGYWGMPEETRQALRGGVLHTGDVGRLDDAGNLTLVDRKSSLIIRGSSNIYPAEVERVLALDERVADSALVPRPDERLGETTIAFVELSAGASASEAELRTLCQEHLARYKVPDEIRIVDALPRNQLGKVHRAVLIAEVRDEAEAEAAT